ncbi:hypothetical protein Pelo_6876 [Pelomyxa schiedti]|nr:hypothetical protein Pelo_6876 [Pelomyxa schiedti]
MPSIHDSSANCDRSRQKSHPQFQVSPPKRVNVHPQVPEAWICNISEHSIANSGVPRTDGKEELRQLAFEPAPTYKKPSTAPPQRVDVFGGTYGDKSLPRRQTPPTPSIKPTQPTRVLARWNLDSSSEYASQGSLATPRSTPTPSNIGFCDPSKCKRSMLEALHPADEKPSAQYVTLAKDLNPSHNLSVPPQTAPSSSVPNSQWPYLTNSKMGHLITASLFPKQVVVCL